MLVEIFLAAPVFVQGEVGAVVQRLMQVVIDTARFGPGRGDAADDFLFQELFLARLGFQYGDYGQRFCGYLETPLTGGEWR